MTVTLRVILIVVSVLTCCYVLRKIRKSQMNIADSLFWIILCIVIVLMSIFSNVVSFLSTLVGVESPSNFVFLVMIFVVLVKLFFQSVEISQQKQRFNTLIQKLALKEKKLDETSHLKGEGDNEFQG